MLTALYTWESAGPIVVSATGQTSTNAHSAKNTQRTPMECVPVVLIGPEKTVASLMDSVIKSATAVWDPGPQAVLTASLTLTKTSVESVYVSSGIGPLTPMVMERGQETVVTNGLEPVPLAALHAPTDTSPSSVQSALSTPTGMKTVSVAVTTTIPATNAKNILESVIHAATAVMAQQTAIVMIAHCMLAQTTMEIVRAMMVGQDLTVRSGKDTATITV